MGYRYFWNNVISLTNSYLVIMRERILDPSGRLHVVCDCLDYCRC